MGIIADLAKQYQGQIDRWRQDYARLCGELSQQAALLAVLQQENQQLRAAHRKELAQPSAQQLHHLQMDKVALYRQLGEQEAETRAVRADYDRLQGENIALHQRLLELTESPSAADESLGATGRAPPDKPKTRRKPGRPVGHEAALRPAPRRIDRRRDVPLPRDVTGKCCCPECHTQLSQIKHHRRLVEDIVPAKVVAIGYATHSGYCPQCRRRVESRDPDQPPPANLPHAQLGINALSTAAVLRVAYRLPMRQVSQLFGDLPGLRVSPGAIAKQLQRMGRWLDGQYDRLKVGLRAAGVVHADETGWRTDGQNGYLWTLTDPKHTLYHVDGSREGRVIVELLGEAFGGTLVSDFYAVYDQFKGPQQKCLVHLLRDLREAMQERPGLVEHAFFTGCKRLLQRMLRLKKQQGQMDAAAYNRQVKDLERRLRNLGSQDWGDADADRLARRLRKYQDRLTVFLHDPAVAGTNNAAERALRPAVVMRKITGGSRSEQGAQAWAVLASVMRTMQQQGLPLVESIKTLLRGVWAGEDVVLLTDLFDTS
jgi:transposase